MADIPRAEASPRLPFKTFRIEKIDSNTTEEDVHQELSGAGIRPVTRLSLASVPNGKSKTATVTVRVDERAVATEYTNVAGVHRRLDTDMFGFTPLSDAVGNRDYVDIIAVTGLAGKAFMSWQYKDGTMWLRDHLPAALPSARVHIYGYDSRLQGSKSTARLAHFTDEFVGLLGDYVGEGQSRPLILIGHSLGCLIIKKMLVDAALPNSRHAELAKRVSLLILFGPPHRGLENEKLRELTLGTWPERLVSDLSPGSDLLKYLNEHFAHASAHIKLITCIEQKATPEPIALEGKPSQWTRSGPEKMMVDAGSASLFTTNETRITINENHSMMAKLSASSHAYIEILRILSTHIEKADSFMSGPEPLTGNDADILASLAFSEMFNRRSDVERPHGSSCQWIVGREEYQCWKAQPRGLLWIKGKPGAGKSTLMSFMYGRLQEQRHAERGVHLDFFFSARGTEMQRTPLGMLRSLLNQLFHQDPSVRPPVRELYEHRCASFGRGGHSWEWQRRELEDLLTSAIKTSAQQQQMTIFIDALDEAGEESAQEIAGYFHRVLEAIVSVSANARICISCRHYPIASTVHGVEVVVEEHNGDDIIAFLDDPLNLDCPRPNDTRDLEQWHGLRTDLVRRAAGVFQWVRLIVPLVQKHINNCEPPEDVRQWLHRVPKELEAVYEHIIRNVIDREHLSQSYKLFQWVCLAEEPLSVTEIRYALAAEGADPSSPRVKCCDTSDFVKTDEQMKGRLRALSGGLVEAVEERVQVIHQSLNEFLLPKGLALLALLQIEGPAINPADNKAAIVGQCQATLYWSCLNYLATELDEDSCLQKENKDNHIARKHQLSESLSHLPFMKYATIHVLVHGEKATVYRGDLSGQIRLLEQIIPQWIGVYEIFDPYSWKCPPWHTTILHVAARANLTDIVERLMGHSPDVGKRHRRTGKLRRERTRKIMKPDIQDDDGYTALHVAAQWGHQSIIEILFHAGASIHIPTTAGQTPLVLAAGNGHLRVLQWLLRQGANLNEARGSSENALEAAARHGEVMIVKFLLDHGVDVNAQGGFYGNALQAASYEGHEKIVQILLERGADVNAQGGEHGSALQAASFNGREKIVQMLLEREVNVNAQGGSFGNALQAASGRGHEKIVQMLFERETDVNAQGGECGNALQAASFGGHEKIVQMLLERGVDVNAQGGYFGNALQAASFGGHGGKIVQILIARGADVNAQGGEYGNALQAASFYGYQGVKQILIDAGAKEELEERSRKKKTLKWRRRMIFILFLNESRLKNLRF